MSILANILDDQCICVDLQSSSRKRTFGWISETVARCYPTVIEGDLFDALQARERLGSTALGEGVAIPHCRLPTEKIIGVLVRLATPIDFDAPDGGDVDLVFALIVPEEETNAHLTILAELSKRFDDADTLKRMRVASTAQALKLALVGEQEDLRAESG